MNPWMEKHNINLCSINQFNSQSLKKHPTGRYLLGVLKNFHQLQLTAITESNFSRYSSDKLLCPDAGGINVAIALTKLST